MIQKKKFSDAIAANISVVGGLLNIGTALLYKGPVNNSDFNSITQNGYYFIQSGNVNGPSADWGYLTVFNFDNQIIQIFTSNTNGSSIFIRKANGKLESVKWCYFQVSIL
jgi:hypothetical protein